jgi:hypothetical protein
MRCQTECICSSIERDTDVRSIITSCDDDAKNDLDLANGGEAEMSDHEPPPT